jgi:hypothetical protein
MERNLQRYTKNPELLPIENPHRDYANPERRREAGRLRREREAGI